MADRGRWIHGATIDKKTRALRFISVSGIEAADTKAGGCKRKWAYEKVFGKRLPDSPWQEEGIKNHAQVATYLTTGKKEIGQLIARGMHMLPEPGSDLLIEWDLLKVPGLAYPEVLTSAHSPTLLANAPVKIAGVPLLGSIDCAHARGLNYGADDIEVTHDPDGTVEVCDWKFVGGTQYLKDASELHENTQLAMYAEWVYTVRPQTPIVRVSLGYFPRKGNARKVSALVTREKIRPQVEHAAGVVRILGEVAKCTDIEQVEGNLEACDKYGGCGHAAYCTAPKRKSMTEYFGQTAADSFYGKQTQGIIPVASLLQRANQAATTAPASGGSLLNPTTPAPAAASAPVQAQVQVAPPAPAPTPEQIAAEQARIAEQERQARLRQMVPPTFAADCNRIREWGRGFPCLKGNAAQALALVNGNPVAPDIFYPGIGEIAYVELTEPSQLAQLVGDLQKNFGPPPTTTPPPATLLAPGTPAMDPSQAAANPELRQAALGTPLGTFQAPTEQMTLPQVAMTMTIQPTADAIAAAQPNVPPGTTTTTVSTDVGQAPAEPAAKPATKRKTKAKAEAGAGETPVTNTAAIHLYIDVATTVPTESLNDWAQEMADKLAQKFGAIDVRCAPEDGPLGYEKWRGALAAFIRDAVAAPLEPGYYSIDTRYSAVMTIIAEALSIRARQTGGTVTRSVR